ncbi:hypothetical protein GUJ93_ZPchr0006g44298 [Zizania palustris]|uniref:Uncharacterized protein n=1 Tax=Zizania palustris TaxID=103762 RepID=A0A8J5SY28_ZIZPA|nr:hypothetical protein GUJ93_ZPchr0006g44298 [Zizania palustris]
MVSSFAPPGPSKKRFRTKFTTKQKEQMREFAHCVGWCIHKPSAVVVDAFGGQVGVSRRILKVWAYVGGRWLAAGGVAAARDGGRDDGVSRTTARVRGCRDEAWAEPVGLRRRGLQGRWWGFRGGSCGATSWASPTTATVVPASGSMLGTGFQG